MLGRSYRRSQTWRIPACQASRFVLLTPHVPEGSSPQGRWLSPTCESHRRVPVQALIRFSDPSEPATRKPHAFVEDRARLATDGSGDRLMP